MAQITKPISVDVAKENIFQAIIAKQYDSKSRFLKVTLTNDGVPIPVASTSVATINVQREDGKAEAFLGTVNDDGTVTVPITNWAVQLDGLVKCDVTIVDTDSRKLTTTMFTLSVEEAAYGGKDISNDPNYDLLVTLLTNCAMTKENCDNATTAATVATAQAEIATGSANSAAEAANNAISSIIGSNNLLLALNSDGSLTLKFIDMGV